MRILFATHQYFPEHIGGTEVFTHGLATRLLKKNDDVAVFTYIESPSGKKKDFIITKTEYEDVPVYQVNYNLNVDPHPATAEYKNDFIKDLFIQVLKEFKPSLVHFTHAMKISGSTMEACKSLNIPYLVTLTDFWFICPRHTLLKWDDSLCNGPENKLSCIKCLHKTHKFFNPQVMKINSSVLPPLISLLRPFHRASRQKFWKDVNALALRNSYLKERLEEAGCVMALSEFQKKMFIRNGYSGDNIVVAHHGPEKIDFNTFKKKENRAFINILMIGSVVRHKGVHIAIEAMKKAGNENLKLLIYGNCSGNDPYVKMIRAEAEKNPNIELCGTFPPESISEIMAIGDVLIMPSLWYENLPLVIKVALMHGIPVIASDLGSLPEMVTEGENGWLLPRDNIKAWAKALKELSFEKLESLHVQPEKIKTMDDNFDYIYSIYQEILK